MTLSSIWFASAEFVRLPDWFGQVQWHNLKSLSLRELQSWACLLQSMLERSSSSLSLASSQTSVVTPPLPKKSSSLHKQPTDTGKNARSRSCRVQTAAALPKQPTAFSKTLKKLMPSLRWKRRTPIGNGDGLPGSWLKTEMVAGRKQLVCRACAHCKPSADSLAHILTTEGDRPRIVSVLRHGRRIAHQQNLKLFASMCLAVVPRLRSFFWSFKLVPLPQKNLNLCGELCGLHHQLPSRCGSRGEEVLRNPWSGVCVRQSETILKPRL